MTDILNRILERKRTRDMERTLIRVDLVVRPEHQARLDIDKLVTGKKASPHGVANSFRNRLNKLSRDDTARDLVFENVAFARSRLDLELDVAKLTPTAGLLFEDLFAGCGLGDSFALSNLGFTHIGLDVEFSLHAIDDDLKVKLAHSRDDRLASIVVGRNLK